MNIKNKTHLIILAAALGYFVDIYDLILFGMVKNPSLMELGITGKDQLFSVGNYLLRMQMIGMLLGGVVWGILGDKKGRLSTLFMTILLYSIANFANGFVQSVEQYAWLRLIAGFGLAGELGVGITLVSEVMKKESRGWGVSFVSGIGIAGSILAFGVSEWFNWRVAYITGGILGLLLLFLRIAVYESGMYEKTKASAVVMGDFLSIFRHRSRLKKYIVCIFIAIPCWYTVSVLAINAGSFADEALGILGEIKGSTSVMLHYMGAAIGSFIFGHISQRYQSRKKAILIAQLFIIGFATLYFISFGLNAWLFYSIIFLMGIPMGGLWAIFIASTSEQFGTNIRATVTTSAPNFVRGATVLITLSLDLLKPTTGLWIAGVITGIFFLGLALLAVFFLEETFHKNLDYIEP